MNADNYELKEALIEHAEELITYALGQPPNRMASSRKDMRWGSHGSFSYAKTGRKRGLWYDHEVEEGGDIFDLIGKRILGISDLREICDWARRWLGWPSGEPAPQTSEMDRRRRENAEKREENERKERLEQERRLARAQRIWDRSQSIIGTLAEKYLTKSRKINPLEWPSALRFDPTECALVVKVETDDGELVGVQIIRITADGRKIPEGGSKRPKVSYGLIGRDFVRLPAPHDGGPLLVAEGPETGLSVWSATGYETRISLGSVTNLVLPQHRRVVVCRDDDDRHARSRRSLTDQIRKWRLEGLNIAEVFPWDRRRYGGLDFNDLMQEGGPVAIRGRIVLALREMADTSNILPVSAAREKLNEHVSGFFARARGGEHIVHALKVSLGVGKTEMALRHAIQNLREIQKGDDEDDQSDRRIVVFSVPEHRLSDDIQRRFLSMPDAVGLTIATWRGRNARDPNGNEKMCRNLDDVHLAQSYLVNIREDVCPECHYFKDCAYVAQEDIDADVIVVTHNMLFHEAIPIIRKRGILALIVDESPWKAGLTGVGDHSICLPLDALDPGVMPVPPGDGPMGGARLTDLRLSLKNALSVEEDGPIRREALVKVGFDKCCGGDATTLEWRRKRGPKSGHWRNWRENQTLKSMVHIWGAVEQLMDHEGPEKTGYLELGRDKNGVRVLILHGHSGLGSGWQAPTLLIDATLDIELISPFWPDVQLIAEIDADAPHQWVFQTSGRSFGKSLLQSLEMPIESETAAKKQAARRNAQRKLKALIGRVDREMGGRILVIGNKRIVSELKLPAHIHRAHFNAVAGRDEWRDVSAIIVIGRTQPPPKAVEEIAAALTGAAPTALVGWYPRGDVFRKMRTPQGIKLVLGEADAHTDPMCERIRSRIAEGEVLQAIGRGRGVNRTAQNPLAVFVLSDVALPLPLDGTLVEDLIFKPTPEDLMLAEGGIAFEDGSAASSAYPRLWKSPEAARAAMHRASSVTFPYKNSSIGDCNAAFRLRTALYQRQGNGQRRATAIIDTFIVSDPRAELERLLGPLVFFELLPVADAPEKNDDAVISEEMRAFCLQALANSYCGCPIPLTAPESDREMLDAYRRFRHELRAEVASATFRKAWEEVLTTWDTDVAVAAERLWEAQNPDLAKARIKRAISIFSAHAELQIRCPDHLSPEAWEQAQIDSNQFMHAGVTDAILQGWPPEAIYGAPVDGGSGLIAFLQGEEIVEFSGGRVLTASGREFLCAQS